MQIALKTLLIHRFSQVANALMSQRAEIIHTCLCSAIAAAEHLIHSKIPLLQTCTDQISVGLHQEANRTLSRASQNDCRSGSAVRKLLSGIILHGKLIAKMVSIIQGFHLHLMHQKGKKGVNVRSGRPRVNTVDIPVGSSDRLWPRAPQATGILVQRIALFPHSIPDSLAGLCTRRGIVSAVDHAGNR